MMLFGEKYGERRARRRDRRLLARAVRRHARPLDRRDRAVRDPRARAPSARARAASRPSPPARRSRSCTDARARRTTLRGELERVRRECEEAAGGVERPTSSSTERDDGVGVRAGRRPRGRDRCAISPTGFGSRRRPAARSSPARPTTAACTSSSNFDERRRAGLDAAKLVSEIGADRRRRRRRQADDGARRAARTPKLSEALARPELSIAARARVKVLALDFGSARTGVAVSDPTGTVARPLGVVERVRHRGRVRRARCGSMQEQERRAGRRRPPADAARRARRAGARDRALRGDAPRRLDVPVVTYDERFTTSLAGGDDARAAAHLLSSYLEWRRDRLSREPAPPAAAADGSRVLVAAAGVVVVARVVGLAAAAGAKRRPPTPSLRRAPKPFRIVFPEGFTRAQMARARQGGREDRRPRAARVASAADRRRPTSQRRAGA